MLAKPQHPSFTLPLHSLHAANQELHKAAFETEAGKKKRQDLLTNAKKALEDAGMHVPGDAKLKAREIKKENHEDLLIIPPTDVSKDLAMIGEELRKRYPNAAGEPYVDVWSHWWGVTFVLSPEATNHLKTGAAGAAGVASVLIGVLALLPPPLNALALVPSVVTAILTIASTVVSMIDNGKGIYVYALWPLIWSPPLWVPVGR